MALNIDLCEFKTLIGSTYGIKVYDDEGKGYDNLMEKDQFNELEQAMSNDAYDGNMQVLEYAANSGDENITEMIENIKCNEEGVLINGSYYEFDDLGF